MPDPLTIRCSYTLEDLQTYKSQAQRRAGGRESGQGDEVFVVMAAGTAIAVVAGLIAYAVGAVENLRNPTVALLCGATFYAGILVTWWVAARQRDQAWRKASVKFLATPRTITIDAQGVAIGSDGEQNWRAWRHLTAMTDADGLIVFWLGESDGVLLPRRVMSDDEAERARAFARAGRQHDLPQ